MKRPMRWGWAMFLAMAVSGCAGGGTFTGAATFDDRAVVIDFADQVAVPTYASLATRAAMLDADVGALAAAPDGDALAAAQAAWRATRQPWEQSEAFLFGPVESQGIDPTLDTWPLNRNDLEAVLASGDPLTPAYVDALPPTQTGFHAIEYLLFGDDGDKTAADLTGRELDYLQAITDKLAADAQRLADSWTTGTPAFRDVFVQAGEPGSSAYPSLGAAVQEMLDGMSGICDEVANGKIAGPYDAHDPQLEESRFSHNSLTDFQNNIRSVQNVYTASVPLAGISGRSLSAWVAERDPQLDARVQAAIEDAIEAIGMIPAPFSNAIVDPAAAGAIENAQQKVRALQSLIDSDLTLLVLG